MKVYNKLVRDKIPEIIESKNEKCTTKVLNDQDYLKELNIKLQEEVKEYLESGEIEELADIEEVLRAILDFKKVPFADFEVLRIKKAVKRGAFKNKIFLISTEECGDR